MVGNMAPSQLNWRSSARLCFLCLTALWMVFAACGAAVLAQSSAVLRGLVGTTFQGTVTSIVDGDTVHVILSNKSALTVRLDGIDTPERGEPFSAQATRATRVMLFSKQVALTATDVDRYGRLVARLKVEGVDAGLELVRQGLACHFTRYSSDPALAQAQVNAQRLGIGFWASGVQRPACATGVRAATRGGAALGPFHGNASSRVFHSATCKNYNCRNCSVVFATAAAAEAAGFKPAGDCLR